MVIRCGDSGTILIENYFLKKQKQKEHKCVEALIVLFEHEAHSISIDTTEGIQ